MVKLLSYQRECIDLANGLFGIEGNAGKTREKAKKEAGKSTSAPILEGHIALERRHERWN